MILLHDLTVQLPHCRLKGSGSSALPSAGPCSKPMPTLLGTCPQLQQSTYHESTMASTPCNFHRQLLPSHRATRSDAWTHRRSLRTSKLLYPRYRVSSVTARPVTGLSNAVPVHVIGDMIPLLLSTVSSLAPEVFYHATQDSIFTLSSSLALPITTLPIQPPRQIPTHGSIQRTSSCSSTKFEAHMGIINPKKPKMQTDKTSQP